MCNVYELLLLQLCQMFYNRMWVRYLINTEWTWAPFIYSFFSKWKKSLKKIEWKKIDWETRTCNLQSLDPKSSALSTRPCAYINDKWHILLLTRTHKRIWLKRKHTNTQNNCDFSHDCFHLINFMCWWVSASLHSSAPRVFFDAVCVSAPKPNENDFASNGVSTF